MAGTENEFEIQRSEKRQTRLVYINRHMHFVCGTLGRAVHNPMIWFHILLIKNLKTTRERGRGGERERQGPTSEKTDRMSSREYAKHDRG